MEEVSEFVVIAPAGQGRAMRFAEQRLMAHLARRFPHYSFRLEAFGPYAEDDEFSVIPIMNRPSRPGDEPGVMYMCRPLDPRVIPQIKQALRAFELAPEMAN